MSNGAPASGIHGVELVRQRTETGFDVTQAFAIGQLDKSHGTELLGTTEAAHPTVAAVTGHTGSRLPAVQTKADL